MFNPTHVEFTYCSSLGLWSDSPGYISAKEAEVVWYALQEITGTIKDNA